MSEQLEKLQHELQKSISEFDIAATCVAHALQSVCKRLDEVEKWISEKQKETPK